MSYKLWVALHWFSSISHITLHVASKRPSESERPLEIMEKSNEGIVRSEVSALSHSSFHLFLPHKWFYCDCCRNFCSSSGPYHSRWDLKALASSHWNNAVSGFVCSYLFSKCKNPGEASLISSYISSVKSPWISQWRDQTQTWSGPWMSSSPRPGSLLEFLCDGGDLLHSVLVSSQVALKGLVLPHQGPDLHQRGRLVVLLGEQLFLAWNTAAT